MQYVGLAIVIASPIAAAIAAYATEVGNGALFTPLAAIAVGLWVLFGWFNAADLDIGRWAAVLMAGMYVLAWLILCHLLVVGGRALRRRHKDGGAEGVRS
jgi:hypothetical protein